MPVFARGFTLGNVARTMLLVALALALTVPAAAQAAGTITVTAGGTRSASDTDSGYANALAGVAFEKVTYATGDPIPAAGSWSALCTTGATGACTSASLPDGRYLVREQMSPPPSATWRTLTQVAWSGSASGVSPTRSYVGNVRIDDDNVTVHPSTTWSGDPDRPTSTTDSGRFMAAKVNPPLPEDCGLDVLLLLDRSGSIDDGGEAEVSLYRDAAKKFVSSLAGTPTRLKIYSFAATALKNQDVFLDLSVPAQVTIANNVIDAVYGDPSGGTNWDAGMRIAAEAAAEAVVFLTDGNPTVRGGDSGTTNEVDLLDLTFGVASANSVKTTGATILAVGAGPGVTALNLAAVSGPTEGADYITSGVDDLAQALQTIANKLCGARIHVRKLTDEGPAARTGWSFVPSKPANSPVTLSAGPFTTAGVPAETMIEVNKIPEAGAPGLTVTETLQAGYGFVASQCQKQTFPEANTGGALIAALGTVQRNDDWYCTFRNTHFAAVKVVKHVINDNGGTATAGNWSLHLKQGATPVAGSPKAGKEAGDTYTVAAGSYSVSETGGPAGYAASFSADCPNGDVSVTPGQTKTCTITNNDVAPSVKVVKHVINDNGGTATAGNWSLHLKQGATPVAGSPKSGKEAGDTYTVAAGSYSVSETGGPAGYAASFSADCPNGDVSVTPGQTKTCTITNNDVAPSVKVVKHVINDNGGTASAGDWSLHLKQGTTPVAGSPKAGKEAGDTYTVAAGSYSVSETGGPAGYAASFSADCPNGDVSVTPGQTKTCTITNNDVAPQLTVVKHVVNKGASTTQASAFQMDVTATNPSDAQFPGTEAGKTITVDAGSFSVDESGGPSTFTKELSGCAGTIAIGQSKTCTITNTKQLPTAVVVKKGPAFAYHGDSLTFTFEVTNPGSTPLTSVTLVDDKCTTITGPQKLDGDQDGSLEQGEKWVYSCTMDVPAHVAGDSSLVNVVTLAATDADGEPVGDTDSHTTRILHPAIAIDKTGSATAQAGRAVLYTLEVSNPGDVSFEAADVHVSDALCVAAPVLTTKNSDASAGQLDPGDSWTYTCSVQTVVGQTVVNNVGVVTGTDNVGGHEVTDDDPADTQLRQPPVAQVVKKGPAFAYHGGSLTFTFEVTNPGSTPLTSVGVSDDKCATITGPQKLDGDQDGSLEQGEKWVYSCTMDVPAHVAGDTSLLNVVTMDATADESETVRDTDSHTTRILHPAIAIDKTGPATAQAGQPVRYTLAVTNPGDVPFLVSNVNVSDALCEAPPIRTTTNGDASSDQLDPGDGWTYTCTVRTLVGQTAVNNVADVTGTDGFDGREVTSRDTARTTLTQPPAPPPPGPTVGQSDVAPVLVRAAVPTGTARLSGPKRCVSGPFVAKVTGRGIARVQFLLDGRKFKTLTGRAGRTVYRVRITPDRGSSKVHRVTARVSYRTSAHTRSQTLRLVYLGCARRAVAARFTG